MRQDAQPPVDVETGRVRGIYDAMAPRYDRMMALAEWLLFGDGRQWACAQATGRVLEVAVGTGRNLACYPADVHLTGVELSPSMLAQAQARAETLHRVADLRLGDAQHLSFPDASFDTVVATFALCSIPDDRAAVAEMVRVLRPGGRLVLLDHVASPARPVRAVQRLLDPLLVRFEGDHLLREPDAAVRAAGLTTDELTRSKWGLVLRLTAHKPTPGDPPPFGLRTSAEAKALGDNRTRSKAHTLPPGPRRGAAKDPGLSQYRSVRLTAV